MKAGWEVRRLGEVVEKVETVDPTKSPDTEFDYVDVSSVSNETFQIEQTTRTLGAMAPSRARRKIRTGDVIFATVRPTLQRIAFVPLELDQQICSTGYMVLRANASVLPKYIYYFLFSDSFSAAMEDLQKGASYPAVTDGEVRDQPIPLPPLDEQKRIVEVLDAAFDGLARARAHTETNLQNARELFESALDFEVLKGEADWQHRTLGEVCQFVGGSQPPKSDFLPNPAEGLVRLIQIRDYKSDAKAVYIPIKLARRFCAADDIMIGRYGPPIFQILRGIEGAYNVALMKAIPEKSLLSNEFLFYFLKNREILRYVIHASSRAAGQDGVNKNALEAYPISFPKQKDQKKIVDLLDQLQVESAKLQSHYRAKLADLDALRQALLQKAFAGELT